jgi:hypothetical protein
VPELRAWQALLVQRQVRLQLREQQALLVQPQLREQQALLERQQLVQLQVLLLFYRKLPKQRQR